VIAVLGEFVPAFEELRNTLRGAELLDAGTPDALAPLLKDRLRGGDVVLLKASRAVRLERVIPLLWPSHATSEVHG
jgi:UDP-N-acetylmuramyl pentapeptide synthase